MLMNGLNCKFKVCSLLHKDKDCCPCCQTTATQYYATKLALLTKVMRIYFRVEMQVFNVTS